MRRLIFVLMFVLLTVPVSGQVIESFEFERGEGTALPIDNAYLIIGDKINRSFRTDYYVTEGSMELEEGAWVIFAMGLGGEDSTNYVTTDLELDFSPTRCVESFGDDWNNAFTITCPLRFLNFEVKSGYELAVLVILALSDE